MTKDIMVRKFQTNEPNKEIVLRVSYDKGSSYPYRKRGYYVTVYPEKTEIVGGVKMRMCEAFTGYNFLLKEVSRASQKAAMESADIMTASADWYAEQVATKNGLTIIK